MDEPDITSRVSDAVVKSEPRGAVRRRPEDSLAKYREIKAADPGRPVFLALTCRFLEPYKQWHKVPKEAVRAMRALAGPGKPLYVWIETCDGGAQQSPRLHVLPRHTRAQVWMSAVTTDSVARGARRHSGLRD